MPSVSVIIPTWNRSGLLEKSIRSALEQTHPPLEILVCDDGSTDNTHLMVESIGDARVRLLIGQRGGLPAIPRNRGIRESKGEWLAFLDDDDEWLPEKLEKQLAAAQRMNCKAVCSNAVRYLQGTGPTGPYHDLEAVRLMFSDLLHVNLVICSSAIIHNTLFSIVEGFPEGEALKAIEDYALWLRVATQTDFAYLAEPLLLYRDLPHGSIRKEGPGVMTQRKRVFCDFSQWGRGRISTFNLRAVRRQVLSDLLADKRKAITNSVARIKRALLK